MAAVTLGSKAEGSIVKLKVNGESLDFIIVHQGLPSALYDSSCDGTWLLMKDVYENRVWHSINSNSYADSTIHAYLNNDFLVLIDTNIRSQIKSVKIPYRPGSGASTTINSGSNGLSCKIFLLSGPEVHLARSGMVGGEGAALNYFASCATYYADSKRIAYYNGSATAWWLRSPVTSGGAWGVTEAGNFGQMSSCVNYFGVRPAFILPSTLYVGDDGTVFTNTAPSTPAGISIPSDIPGGMGITVSWEPSTDTEGNLAGYIVEKSIDSGSTWSVIYSAQSPATSAQDNVAFGTPSVMYRVKAFDTEGLESDWCVSANVTVVNNRAPSAPASITVPLTVNGGADLVISWGAATDSDGNLAGYELERQVDGGEWEQLCRENVRAFTDRITKGWETVAYRVRAYDDLDVVGPYKTSDTRTVNNNTAPVITCATPSGRDLGVKAEGFTVDYSVGDVDGDTVIVTEAIDGVVARSFQAELGQSYTVEVMGSTFMRVLNGKHILTITADDGQAATVYALNFEKKVTKATITLDAPMDADAEITVAILSVIGNIPADAEYIVEATNNAKDEPPVWQDVTEAVKAGANIVFENHTAENGFAFNFQVTVERGENGRGGYITSIQGGFQ